MELKKPVLKITLSPLEVVIMADMAKAEESTKEQVDCTTDNEGIKEEE